MSLSKQQINAIVEDCLITYAGTTGLTLPVDPNFVPIGVNFVIHESDVNAASLHIKWIQWMKDQGWSKGLVFSRTQKLHPEMVVFEELSADIQRQWIVFRNLVRALTWL